MVFRFSDYLLTPSSIPIDNLTVDNITKDKILQFEGYMNKFISMIMFQIKFYEKIPFENYIIIRPEAMDATYVKTGKSLVSELVDIFSLNGHNIVLLPSE